MHTPRILLIEADQDTHRGLRDRLELRGCRVFSAKTQPEAVLAAGEIEADLVVQENPLPDAPGSFDEIMSAIETLVGPLPHRDGGRSRRLQDAAAGIAGLSRAAA